MTSLAVLLDDIRACRLCAAQLPLPPRPLVQAGDHARMLIVGQAPGRKAHLSGLPFDDASGERLRAWLGIDRTLFYDANRVAIVPMGMCYPGSTSHGDLPPRPECAPTWHPRLLPRLREVRLTLLIGRYAQTGLLGVHNGPTLTNTVRDWRRHRADGFLPLPHPSPRNQAWLKHNPWFEQALLPALRCDVAAALH